MRALLRTLIFMETVAALGLGPDDPELVLAAANASLVVSLAEIPRTIDESARRSRSCSRGR